MTTCQSEYLTAHRDMSVEELAKALGLTEKKVAAELKKLAPPKKRNRFATHPSGAVVMTESQSFQDDIAEGTSPFSDKKPQAQPERLREGIHIIHPE